MYLAAGGYLGKLARRDFIMKKWSWPAWNNYNALSKGYVLTVLGEALLKEAEEEDNG